MTSSNIRHAFVTVTDSAFFPGTVAVVNSVLRFHPHAEIYVINNEKRSLTREQTDCLSSHPQVNLRRSTDFAQNGRFINAWELKAYSVCDLSKDYDVIIGIDSDSLLCSNLDDKIEECFETGGFIGGRDGDYVDYDDAYRVYGISTPARNPSYMSTAIFFVAVNSTNRHVLRRWADCCNSAIFNGTGNHPGHGDQGVLNAVLFSENMNGRVALLDNLLWSQHWTFWESTIQFSGHAFLNRSVGSVRQRSFHCAGHDKFWTKVHRDRALTSERGHAYCYAWFLALLWFGACKLPNRESHGLLGPGSLHLIEDRALLRTQFADVLAAALE